MKDLFYNDMYDFYIQWLQEEEWYYDRNMKYHCGGKPFNIGNFTLEVLYDEFDEEDIMEMGWRSKFKNEKNWEVISKHMAEDIFFIINIRRLKIEKIINRMKNTIKNNNLKDELQPI